MPLYGECHSDEMLRSTDKNDICKEFKQKDHKNVQNQT